MAKTVLVLGGGIGGVVAARELRKWLGSSDRVILIDKDGKHLFAPSLLWVMEGKREARGGRKEPGAAAAEGDRGDSGGGHEDRRGEQAGGDGGGRVRF